MAQVTNEINEIMGSVLENFENVKADWEKITEKYSVAGARRIRKALDEIARKKVDLRKAMLEEEKK